MDRVLLAVVTFLAKGIAGCETHHVRDHARWEHRDHDYYYQWRSSGAYLEHERGYQPLTLFIANTRTIGAKKTREEKLEPTGFSAPFGFH